MRHPLALSLSLLTLACGPESRAGDASPADTGETSGAGSPVSAEPPVQGPSETVLPPVDRGEVVARVGEVVITRGDLVDRLDPLIVKQLRGQQPDGTELVNLRLALEPKVLEAMIDETLIDAELDRKGIDPGDDVYRAELESDIATYMRTEGMTKEELEQKILATEGRTYEEFLAVRVADERFRRQVRHITLLKQEYPERTSISENTLRASYEEQLEELWTEPESVRASHILFRIPEDDAEGEAGVRAEAERVLALAREEGADFAALAREHSEGPSAAQGGDLGFFSLGGAIPDAFAEPAFELEVGEVSDVVETPWGLHVIRLTDRRGEEVVPLEEVAPTLRWQLEQDRLIAVREEHLEGLRAAVEIERP